MRFLPKKVREDFIIIDSQFPQKNPMGFRNIEISEYLRKYENVTSYAMSPMSPGDEAWFVHGYGVDGNEFRSNLAGYLKFYPEHKNRIKYLDINHGYKVKLAYSFFLAETYVLLPFFEKNKIPFTFILYPGGAFGIDNVKSDAMLKAIFSSKYFRRVIVTQNITRDYLISKHLCEESRIDFVYGGFAQYRLSDVRKKRLYPVDKSTFDVCFVAAKYSERGVDKGYDLFIESAKLICKQAADVRFHVIGNFDEKEIDVVDLGDRIKFYGFVKPERLPKIYSGMDIFLSPNRPGQLYEGNFDGFPIGVDAGYCGVAMFVSDELGMNEHFVDGEDIVLIPLEAPAIAKKVLHYYNETEGLYELSAKGAAKSQSLFSIDNQLEGRVRAFQKHVTLKPRRGL